MLIDLDDEIALFERYSEANGIPVCDYKFFFDENMQHPPLRERFWQAVRRLLIINEYKRTKKFRLSEMIGKLRSKMEEERKKIEAKKQKEGFFSDEVNDILTKYILEKLRINAGMVELFNHATELDARSNKITALFNERDKIIRNLTTNLYLLVEDFKKNSKMSSQHSKMLARSITLFNSKDPETPSPNGDGELESLKSNLDTFKINEGKRASESRGSFSAAISPEEMTKIKNRLVTMIKTEQEEKPFKKVLKKKLARYEERLKNRHLKTMKTTRWDSTSPGVDPLSPLAGREESKNMLLPGTGARIPRKNTLLKKRKTITKKTLL